VAAGTSCYGIFDCAMPTDARHGREYLPTLLRFDCGLTGYWLKYLYINDERKTKPTFRPPLLSTARCAAVLLLPAPSVQNELLLILRLPRLHNLSL